MSLQKKHPEAETERTESDSRAGIPDASRPPDIERFPLPGDPHVGPVSLPGDPHVGPVGLPRVASGIIYDIQSGKARPVVFQLDPADQHFKLVVVQSFYYCPQTDGHILLVLDREKVPHDEAGVAICPSHGCRMQSVTSQLLQ